MAFSAGTIVNYQSGRQGVVVYDNASVTDDSHASVYVIFPDGTYRQSKRVNLTSAGAGWLPGTGPGQ